MASVAIVYNAIDERGTSRITEDDVKRLVASSVEDLKPTAVTVVMKPNMPQVLVDRAADSSSVETPVAAVTQFGMRFADKRSASRVLLYGIIAMITSILCLAVGVGGIVRAMGLKRRAARAEAELTSQRKARRETQTGMQPQQ
jgi:type III secretory pathway lipoprotein EscJ